MQHGRNKSKKCARHDIWREGKNCYSRKGRFNSPTKIQSPFCMSKETIKSYRSQKVQNEKFRGVPTRHRFQKDQKVKYMPGPEHLHSLSDLPMAGTVTVLLSLMGISPFRQARSKLNTYKITTIRI